MSLRGRLREIGGGVVRRVMLFGNRMDENMFRTVAISETVFWRRRAGERERERESPAVFKLCLYSLVSLYFGGKIFEGEL